MSPADGVSPERLVSRARAQTFLRQADAARWTLTADDFAAALDASARKAFADRVPSGADLDHYLGTLHLADLALATACACGCAAAWDHFVLTHRPLLYRAADALTPGGQARELADGLYAELFGVQESGGVRRSLLRYFHGRSSLSTWLRTVLAQRYVDMVRAQQRTQPIADRELVVGNPPTRIVDPDRDTLVPLVERALRTAIERLPAKDRLRLRSYYVSRLTLAEIGRLTGEHEATVSRHLARTRRDLRTGMEHSLRTDAHLPETRAARAVELALEDPGELDLGEMLGTRKNPSGDRSE